MKKNKKMTKKTKMYTIIATTVAVMAFVVMGVLFFTTQGKDDLVIEGTKEKVNENFTFLLEEESTAINNDDIFSGQAKIRDEYLAQYKKGNYTVENPYVLTNPFLISPQSALVMFKTTKSEKVTVTIKGKHNNDITRTFEASKDHFIPLYGLYGNYKNQVVIKTDSGKSKTIEIEVKEDPKPANVKVTENKLGNTNGEFYFATSSLGIDNLAFDNYGEIRWYLTIGYNKGMTLLQNGHLLISTADAGPDVTSTSGVAEVDMMGFVHRIFEVEGGYHHDGHEMENGNLLLLTTDLKHETIADYIVEVDRQSGKVVKDWSLREIVSKIDDKLIEHGAYNWGWINSITYDKNNKALILSVRNQNSVVSLDYETGKINWILGEKKYWSNKFNSYLLKGEGNEFIYPAGQHSVHITKDGKLSIFNNGYNANHEKATACKNFQESASYAMVYSINEANKTATVDWKFGGKEYFSYALSSFTYTENQHKVFNSGWHFSEDVKYDDPDCNQFSNDKYDAYILEFDENNNIVLNMHIEESKFEVLKSDIYNLAQNSVTPSKKDIIENYEVETGKYLSTNEPDEYKELSGEEALSYKTSEPLFISYMMYNNRFKLVGAVPEEMDMKVTFIALSGHAYQYTLKEEGKTIKDFLILDKLPKGRYYVYVNMGNKVYNATEYIEIG